MINQKRIDFRPCMLVLFYWCLLYAIGGLKFDHIVICSIPLILFYWNRHTRQLLLFFLPLLLSGILYDSMRHYADYLRGPIHVSEPYLLEKNLFGISVEGGKKIQTANEYLQSRTNSTLDVICGFAYLVFILEYIIVCLLLYVGQHWKFLRMAAWSFFWVNFFGYVTYYVYAAAPPWYVADHGLGPAIISTPPSAAGAARFDLLLGTNFFSIMYSKSADVFGSIPSLHVSYPFLAMVFAWKTKRFMAFSVAFFLLMCFSAVYLNHHYILDVILGVLYAALTFLVVEFVYKKRQINPNSIF